MDELNILAQRPVMIEKTLSDHFHQKYPSDHFPVLIQLTF